MTQQIDIRVDGARAARAVATWGQRAIWHCLEFPDADETQFSLSRVVPVPEGCDLATVATAIAALVRRHDALRTTFAVSDGELWQAVSGAGTLPAHVRQTVSDVDGEARGLAAELAGVPFARDRWPIRVALVCDLLQPRAVAVACSHLAVDRTGIDELVADLAALMAGNTPKTRRRGPLEQSDFEQSAAGQAQDARARRHWAAALSGAPTSIFDYPRRTVGNARFRRRVMHSPALTPALAAAATSLRVSTTAVLVAAAATALGRYTGHTRVVLQTICANRIDPDQRNLVGTLSWDGVLVIDVDGSLRDVARQAFRAGVRAQSHGHYDPERMWQLRREHELARGATLDLGAHVNDMRQDATASGEPVEYARLLQRTRIVDANCADRIDARWYLTGRTTGATTMLSLVCDTADVTVTEMDQLLRAIEGLVVAGATEGGDTVAIQPVTRGPNWHPSDGGWVDIDATGRLWRQVAADERARVFPDGPGGLVGYLPAGRDSTAERLHRRFVTALDGRTDVRAPARYVLCAGAPASLDERRAWDELPVVAQGSGRPGGSAT